MSSKKDFLHLANQTQRLLKPYINFHENLNKFYNTPEMFSLFNSINQSILNNQRQIQSINQAFLYFNNNLLEQIKPLEPQILELRKLSINLTPAFLEFSKEYSRIQEIFSKQVIYNQTVLANNSLTLINKSEEIEYDEKLKTIFQKVFDSIPHNISIKDIEKALLLSASVPTLFLDHDSANILELIKSAFSFLLLICLINNDKN